MQNGTDVLLPAAWKSNELASELILSKKNLTDRASASYYRGSVGLF